MPRLAWYAVAFLCAMGLGAYALKEHQARVVSDQKVTAWKDSVQRATVRAETAEHLFDSTKAAYYALKPAVVTIDRWHQRVDTVLASAIDTLKAGDSLALVNVIEVKALFDSLTTECAKRDSVARVALEAASGALRASDSARTLALHPPTAPVQRVGFFVQGAYDPISRAVPVLAGAELRLGHIKPYVAVGAAIAQQTTGTLQVGVRYEW